MTTMRGDKAWMGEGRRKIACLSRLARASKRIIERDGQSLGAGARLLCGPILLDVIDLDSDQGVKKVLPFRGSACELIWSTIYQF